MSSGCRVTAARRAKRCDLIIKMSSKAILVFFGAVVKGPSPCMEHLLGSLLLMTENQNGIKISLRGDIQVCHIPLPYFSDFMIPTNSRLIAENVFPRTKNSKHFPVVPNRDAAFNRTPLCKNLDPLQETRISIKTRDNAELQIGTIKTVVT